MSIKSSVLDVLGNARSAAKDARQQLVREVQIANAKARLSPDRTADDKQQQQQQQQPQKLNIDVLFERGGAATPRQHQTPNSARRARTPLGSGRSTSSVNNPHRHYEQVTNTAEEVKWMGFVADISDKEQKAASAAAHMQIDDLDEQNQLENDFLSGLDEETWDFDADLFSALDDEANKNVDMSSSRGGGGNRLPPSSHSPSTGGELVRVASLRTGGATATELASPETRRKNAERATFWTLRRIIEKLQGRLKSVVQQRDSYKTLLGRYSYVASELHSAARRCDAATTVLSDRYRRVVQSEMAGREIKPAFPPGTVLFGHAGSQQGKEVKPEQSMATFGYPVEGNVDFAVSQPHFVEESKSIITPQSPGASGGGLGVPARGVDWEIVGDLEKDAAKAVATTHDEELRHMREQLASAYRRHCRDIRTVATMRRSVMDALDHAKGLEHVIHEKDHEILLRDNEIASRDKMIALEKENSAKLRKQIQDLLALRSELDEELGRAGDNEHDLGERLKELKETIDTARQQKEREALQRKEEAARLRAAMNDYLREMEGAHSVWKKQWKPIRVKSKALQQELHVQQQQGAGGGGQQQQQQQADSSSSDLAAVIAEFGAAGENHIGSRNSSAQIDFSSQWLVVNEVFEQKRVDLSSRCNPDNVNNWNFIFKAVLDLWHFSKEVHESLKQRDEMLQSQYSIFEDQLKPLLFELRQVDEAAAVHDGRGGDASAMQKGRGVFSMLRAANRMGRSGSKMGDGFLSGDGGGGGDPSSPGSPGSPAGKTPLEVRKDVVEGVDRFKQFIGNFESEDLSPIIRAFATLFSDMFARNDSLWKLEYDRTVHELEATKRKLNESQMRLGASESGKEELKKSLEEMRTEVSDLQRKRNAWNLPGIESGGDWSELCPSLATALDGLEARFDTWKTATARGGSSTNPSELSKLRAEVVEDLEHFDRALKAVRTDADMATFPPGFVPASCLSKVVHHFVADAKWLNRSLGHQSAIDAMRLLTADVQAVMGDVKQMRHAAGSALPSVTLVDSRFMPENELSLRAKATGHLGSSLRRVFARFSALMQSVQHTQKALSGAGSGGSGSSDVPLVAGPEISAFLYAVNGAFHGLLEELQATIVAGSLGQWSTVHRALMNSAAIDVSLEQNKKDDAAASGKKQSSKRQQQQQQQQQQPAHHYESEETVIKPGGHAGSVYATFLDNAFETVLGSAPNQEPLPSVVAAEEGGLLTPQTAALSPPPQHHHGRDENNNNSSDQLDSLGGGGNNSRFAPSSIDDVISMLGTSLDPVTSRLLISRFQEMVMFRGALAAPFIGASNVKDNEEELHMIAQLQHEKRQLQEQLQQVQNQLSAAVVSSPVAAAAVSGGGGGIGGGAAAAGMSAGAVKSHIRKMTPVQEGGSGGSSKAVAGMMASGVGVKQQGGAGAARSASASSRKGSGGKNARSSPSSHEDAEAAAARQQSVTSALAKRSSPPQHVSFAGGSDDHHHHASKKHGSSRRSSAVGTSPSHSASSSRRGSHAPAPATLERSSSSSFLHAHSGGHHQHAHSSSTSPPRPAMKDSSTQVEKKPRLLRDVHAAASSQQHYHHEDEDEDEDVDDDVDSDIHGLRKQLIEEQRRNVSGSVVRIKLPRSRYNRELDSDEIIWGRGPVKGSHQHHHSHHHSHHHDDNANQQQQQQDDEDDEELEGIMVVDIAAQTDPALLRGVVEQHVAVLNAQLQQQQQQMFALQQELDLQQQENADLVEQQEQQQQNQQQQRRPLSASVTTTARSGRGSINSARRAADVPNDSLAGAECVAEQQSLPPSSARRPPSSPAASARSSAGGAAERQQTQQQEEEPVVADAVVASPSSARAPATGRSSAASTATASAVPAAEQQAASRDDNSSLAGSLASARGAVPSSARRAESSNLAEDDQQQQHLSEQLLQQQQDQEEDPDQQQQPDDDDHHSSLDAAPPAIQLADPSVDLFAASSSNRGSPGASARPGSAASQRPPSSRLQFSGRSAGSGFPSGSPLLMSPAQQQLAMLGGGTPGSPNLLVGLGASFLSATGSAATSSAGQQNQQHQQQAAAAVKEKVQQATRAVQVTMDPIRRPPTSTVEAQTDHTTYRGFVTTVNAANLAGKSAAVDFHRPHEWVPAVWKKVETTARPGAEQQEVEHDDEKQHPHQQHSSARRAATPTGTVLLGLPDGPSTPDLQHSMSVNSNTPSGRMRPPTPNARADTFYRPKSAMSIPHHNDHHLDEDAKTLRQWRIHGGGGAMFVLRLEKPPWALRELEARGRRQADSPTAEQQRRAGVPWQPETAHLFADEMSAGRSRRRSPSPTASQDGGSSSKNKRNALPIASHSDFKHRQTFDSPSSLNQSSARQRVLEMNGSNIIDVSQQLAAELQQHLTAATTTTTPQQQHQQAEDHPHQHQQHDVDRIREMSYLRRRIEDATAQTPPPLSQSQLTQLQDPYPMPAFDRSLSTRPLSAAQQRVAKQYRVENLGVYSPPPTANEHALDAAFCKEVGLTPGGGVRSRVTPAELRRPTSPAHERAMANANGGVFMSRTVEKALAAKKRIQLEQAKRREDARAAEEAGEKSKTLSVQSMMQQDFLKMPERIRNSADGKNAAEMPATETVAKKRIGQEQREFAQDPHVTQSGERRREFGNLSALATSLCGPGSLLARRLATKE